MLLKHSIKSIASWPPSLFRGPLDLPQMLGHHYHPVPLSPTSTTPLTPARHYLIPDCRRPPLPACRAAPPLPTPPSRPREHDIDGINSGCEANLVPNLDNGHQSARYLSIIFFVYRDFFFELVQTCSFLLFCYA